MLTGCEVVVETYVLPSMPLRNLSGIKDIRAFFAACWRRLPPVAAAPDRLSVTAPRHGEIRARPAPSETGVAEINAYDTADERIRRRPPWGRVDTIDVLGFRRGPWQFAAAMVECQAAWRGVSVTNRPLVRTASCIVGDLARRRDRQQPRTDKRARGCSSSFAGRCCALRRRAQSAPEPRHRSVSPTTARTSSRPTKVSRTVPTPSTRWALAVDHRDQRDGRLPRPCATSVSKGSTRPSTRRPWRRPASGFRAQRQRVTGPRA